MSSNPATSFGFTATRDRWQDHADAYLGSDDPLPDAPNHEIGEGDFRAIGAEFLGHMVQLGGLRPNELVLDLGCGFGRMALPLARYLSLDAQYLGFDVVAEPVAWCQQHVASLHPGFEFRHVDLAHPLYNPKGRLQVEDLLLALPEAVA